MLGLDLLAAFVFGVALGLLVLDDHHRLLERDVVQRRARRRMLKEIERLQLESQLHALVHRRRR